MPRRCGGRRVSARTTKSSTVPVRACTERATGRDELAGYNAQTAEWGRLSSACVGDTRTSRRKMADQSPSLGRTRCQPHPRPTTRARARERRAAVAIRGGEIATTKRNGTVVTGWTDGILRGSLGYGRALWKFAKARDWREVVSDAHERSGEVLTLVTESNDAVKASTSAAT